MADGEAKTPLPTRTSPAESPADRDEELLPKYRDAAQLHPDRPAHWINLAIRCERLNRWAEAAEAYARVATLRPREARAHLKYGLALRRLHRPGAAIGPLRRSIELRPDDAAAWHALASAVGDLGRYAEAAEAFAKAAELDPGNTHLGSDAVHLLHYDPAAAPDALLAAAEAWAARHAEPLTRRAPPHLAVDRDRDPDRRIRVGFVSGDFREHPVGRLAVPTLTHLDRSQFELTCYDDARRGDAITERLSALTGVRWRRTVDLKYDELDQQIRADGIDVLVDWCGHMGTNRLKLFARKPAPVQVTHFNYPDTTGMTAMGWRVSDDLAEPPELNTDRYSVERLCRLGPCGWCYDAGLDAPPVGPLPLDRNGYVTFASLNKPLKHTDAAAQFWARILAAVPGSKLLLLGLADASENALLAKRYTDAGLPGDRLIFAPRMARPGYLAAYNQTDVCLDPFPYNGGITSCDAMYMGVPIVALAGTTYHSRQGLMLLTNVGLPELVAPTPDEYVATAVRLANDRDRLALLRVGLRQRLTQSPVMDGIAFARRLGDGIRMMWRDFCERSATTIPRL